MSADPQPSRESPAPACVVVDTSALMAVLLGEPEGEPCAAILGSECRLLISAGTLAEALVVARHRGIAEEMSTLIRDGGIDVVPVTAATAARIDRAYATWGKGRHPASLNFGDCFAYVLAQEVDAPLLFVGQDFPQTDVRVAVAQPAAR